jgi:hypothetical protein
MIITRVGMIRLQNMKTHGLIIRVPIQIGIKKQVFFCLMENTPPQFYLLTYVKIILGILLVEFHPNSKLMYTKFVGAGIQWTLQVRVAPLQLTLHLK